MTDRTKQTKTKRRKPAAERGKRRPQGKRRASARLQAAARENGKRGGRPRRNRTYDDFENIPVPPAHPVRLGQWLQRVLAIDVQRIVEGRAVEELSQEIRAYATAMAKLLQPVIVLVAGESEADWWRNPSRAPPADDEPVAMSYWVLARLAESLHACIRGEAHAGAELRASVTAYVKAIPPDTMHGARRKVRASARELDAHDGPKPRPAKETHDDQRYQPISC